MALFKRIIPGFLLFFSCLCNGQSVFKDSLRINLDQADQILINRNLSLLAEKCKVDAAKALIIQAGIFNNPTFTVNQNVYNTDYEINGGRKWFDLSDKGETSVQVEQLFFLAGKRNKRIKLAELTANREESLYFDLVRSLKFSMHSGFYNLLYFKKIITVYDKEISSLSNLVKTAGEQVTKGNFSKKELYRMKSMLFSLENEKLGFVTQQISAQTEFNVLMQTSGTYYLPQQDTALPDSLAIRKLKIEALIDTAFQHRYDLKMAQSDLQISKVNLSYQKALAVPDLTISGGWDKNGSYVHNYNFIGIQFDLPFFNRNQGNILSARSETESSKYQFQITEDRLRADILNAFASALETNKLYERFDQKFVSALDQLTDEMLKNFEKRNISLLEFLDYYDAYKQNAIQMNTLLFNRLVAFENLNYSVGKDVMHIQ